VTKPSKKRGATRVRQEFRSERVWSRRVTSTSNALDLDPNVFTLRSPRAIALSLKRSAERSKRRRSTPFRSAMSMLVFYINRAGKNLKVDRRRVLGRAKLELRKLFGRGRTPSAPSTRRKARIARERRS
jgi:hypothetical protein